MQTAENQRYKKRFWKKPEGKKHMYRKKDKNYIWLFSETMRTKRVEWMFKALKEKTHQPRTLYPTKLSFKAKESSDASKMTEQEALDLPAAMETQT